ncbi:FHA domain-containing protein [Bdellovibrio sp. SKB1291214]|uniref:FHA domain-containing protein n=1 Tax=Bdellovibrio sp. SKB1291214 TaxID=1732569 RepID=UPI000B51C86D|nr:FHA domain-containing protein [Bdellovibrio sp. SKB1291214]UYL10160.1 FHA domain-containing protein [Bdellovibrio sp. SKB1291214]
MAHLIVRLRGKTVYNMPLEEGRTYVAGRKEDCDIVLQPEKGISREHFKIVSEGGQWTLQVISRYGDVMVNGEPTQQATLDHGFAFTISPYEFDFLMSSASAHPASMEAGPVNSEASYLPVVQGSEPGEEKTIVGAAPTAAYIKIVDSNNDAKEMIRLDDGDSWIAGRDPSCHIQIRDQRVSRRQFELRRNGNQYQIIDLGSVNGTLLNGNPISATDPTNIRSGDAITVLDNYLYFELHDAHFQSRLDMVKVAPPNPLVQMATNAYPSEYDQQYGIAPYQQQGGVPMQYPGGYGHMPGPVAPAPEVKAKFDFQKHRPKLIAGAIVFLAIVYLFAGGEKKEGPVQGAGPVAAPGSPQEVFNKLKPEQQSLIRQRYKDAKNLYMQGKYQLAQDEITKIQDLVPDYEDTKEIQRLAKEAVYLQQLQERNAQIEKEKAEAELKIQNQAAICQKKLNPNITMDEMDSCISSVIQFNPDHPKLLDLKVQVEALTAARDARKAQQAEYQSQVSRLKGLFAKAQQLHKTSKKPLDIIDAYDKVVGSKLPDPGGLKGQASRSIASVRTQMNQRIASNLAQSDKLYQAGNLKGAILALRQAKVIDPENPEVPAKIEKIVTELRKQMMTLYQEGILEESFGNVEGGESKAGAKEKWKKILELDIPDGEYYKKAYIKLKKYGAM